MATIPSFSFDALPNDDKIYRLYWAGEIQLSNSDDESHQVYAWIKEVDEDGQDIPGAAFRRIVQSTGAIPRLHIGSLWQSQKPYSGKRLSEFPLVDLEIEAQSEWQVVQAGSRNTVAGKHSDGRNHLWVNPSDYSLRLVEDGGQIRQGFNAWVVPMRTVDGLEVVVPCYELFRAFYAGSSELSWRLLAEPWSGAQKHFLNDWKFIDEPHGQQNLLLDTVAGVGKGVLPFLGVLVTSKAARSCAEQVNPNLLQQAQESGEQAAWVQVVPPFLNERFHLRVRANHFASRSGLLVTKIESASFPGKFSNLVYLQDEYVSEPPKDGEEETGGENKGGGNPKEKRVNRSGKRRPTARKFRLNIGTNFWLDAPRMAKAVRNRVEKDQQTKGKEEPDLPKQQVGVGGQGNHEADKQASFEHSGVRPNTERMEALFELILKLLGNGIDQYVECPLVNPVAGEGWTYCALPTDIKDAKSLAWAKGDSVGDEPPRLVWVARFDIGKQSAYWIEVEHIRDSEHFCSLAFKMIGDAQFDEEILVSVLQVCVQRRGRWPEHATENLSGKVQWVKAKHFLDDLGGLRASTIAKAMERLGIMIAI